mmetsp:Transcript_14143/g.26604  ORF Transcript_14143/g.26604 Transcript_14143/m.26604 type:complete len:273 (+) Transcript_14143:410-1228(+)
MGASWAWPCDDRERRKRHIESRKPRTSGKAYLHSNKEVETVVPEPTIRVDSVRTTQLDRYLREVDPTEADLLSVCAHPLHPEETLVAFDTACEPQLNLTYRAFDFSLSGESLDDWIPLIKHELSTHHELHGRNFLGATQAAAGNALYFAFSKEVPGAYEPTSTYYVRGICDFINREILSSLLNEVQTKKKALFKASIMRQNIMMLIFELKDKYTDFSYLVVDCPEVDLYSPNLKLNLATRIESNISDENIEFVSFIANPLRRELFMVFAIFP